MFVGIDSQLGSAWIDGIPWPYANEPEGARAMLSAIAGSVISVAGVTFSSVGVLIYFIHHVSQTIRVSYVIHQVSVTLQHRIDSQDEQALRPAFDVDGAQWRDVPDDFGERAVIMRAPRSGYVQAIDNDRLVALAAKHDLLVSVLSRPGDFVVDDGALLQVLGRTVDDPRVRKQLTDTFLLGMRRTDSQDTLSLVQQRPVYGHYLHRLADGGARAPRFAERALGVPLRR